MPLQHAPVGSKGFGENIKREMEAGKPQKQAVAIAYRMSGEKKDGIDGDPADIARATERMDAIADSLREVGRRMDAAAGAEAEGKMDHAGRKDAIFEVEFERITPQHRSGITMVERVSAVDEKEARRQVASRRDTKNVLRVRKKD